jgi:hypothetical protein
MRKETSLLLTCAPAAWLFSMGHAQACPYEEIVKRDEIWCGGSCGNRHDDVPALDECNNDDDGCTEPFETDLIVCQGCPYDQRETVEFCGGAGCSCGDSSS